MMADAIRVLYVDDEPYLLDIGKLFLEESGEFSVTTIASAPAALELLNKEKFDAIVSDYQMPGMDGIEFLVEVRTRFGKVPFILFTGKGREEVVIQAINNGADFYIQKGDEPDAQFAELGSKIKNAVKRIFADLLFEKVLYNLIDNTIRHGETATEVHVSVITEQGGIRIIWEDNGVGVPADQKEMIFNRGYGKNTGLGLFLTQEILAITGMTIQENGEPGKGARFEIMVPNGRYRNYQENQD